MAEQQTDQRANLKNQEGEHRTGDSESSLKVSVSSSRQKVLLETDHEVLFPSTLNKAVAQIVSTQKQQPTLKEQTENSLPDNLNPTGASLVLCEHEINQKISKRCKPSDVGEDPHPQKAKRTCLGRPPALIQTHSAECSTQASKPVYLPPTPLLPVEAKSESKAFPVSEWKKTTVEVELLTLGKQAQRLPLTSNNTAQTNQNRLATSLRGLSVKPASSGSSISSRSTLGEEGSENVPRNSRSRRLQRSWGGDTVTVKMLVTTERQIESGYIFTPQFLRRQNAFVHVSHLKTNFLCTNVVHKHGCQMLNIIWQLLHEHLSYA